MNTRKLGQSATVFEHDDPIYTEDPDPFNIRPLLLQPRRRRSSMLNKWIQDQQQVPVDVADTVDTPGSGTRSNPYLAYPELGSPTFHESAVSVESYDLVDDDDIPPEHEISTTPTTTPSKRGSKRLHTPSSFCNFRVPFRSASPAGSVATSSATPPRTPIRGLFFPNASRSTSSANTQHTRSSSISTLNIVGENDSLPPPSTPKSRWRPSVLGHFGTAASQPSVVVSDSQHTRSRPSISSNYTYTTTTRTSTDGDIPVTPPQSSAASSRARSRSYGGMLQMADNGSLWSGPGPSYLDILERSPLGSTRGPTSTMSCDGYIGMPPRVPLGPKPGSRLAASNKDPDIAVRPAKQGPEVAYSSEAKSRTLPRVSFASLGTRAKKKRRLVISGIATGDTRRFEAAKRWCQSFGEVSQITRMPNDDLHVHFRNAEVADTVCRVNAKVYIRGVGSVQLSWYAGNGIENNR
ncbi:hypothetical protein B0H15DRAFT_206352 [Mycena belliarum]|uniref:Uncharacterized protein n=1 Tax=Mycena belliarum TaxID=1033014 RepID=A0AAD6Y1P1_9AGAR|nr:hypothetical protein B0H15DRAFT_206352 [Mycena belliae]